MNSMKMNNMNHSMTEPKEIMIMLLIMFIAGLLSTMNIWVDKISDMHFHLNDVYMALLMCGWMLVLMGIYYININIFVIGIIMTVLIIYCIRNQIFINETQYLKGMIPHHSMAVLMSKKLLEKANNKDKNNYNYNYNNNNKNKINSKINKLASHIINSQEDEIKLMKLGLQYKHIIKNL